MLFLFFLFLVFSFSSVFCLCFYVALLSYGMRPFTRRIQAVRSDSLNAMAMTIVVVVFGGGGGGGGFCCCLLFLVGCCWMLFVCYL